MSSLTNFSVSLQKNTSGETLATAVQVYDIKAVKTLLHVDRHVSRVAGRVVLVSQIVDH